MTDETGMLQHAIFTVPNYREGYATDDNARALMVSALLEALGSGEALELASRYLAFIWYAFNTETGRFRNFMDYQRHWLEEGGSDDSHGRALWALGTMSSRSNTPALHSMAGQMFQQALPGILTTTSPRAWAFALIGSNGFYQQGGERAQFDQQPVEAQAMVSACLEAYRITGDKRWRREARRAFEWFLGRNDLNLPIYDPTTGGCRDGLHPDRPNENQGAESTLAFLHALLELRLTENTLLSEEMRS